jgi:hypothetical protein
VSDPLVDGDALTTDLIDFIPSQNDCLYSTDIDAILHAFNNIPNPFDEFYRGSEDVSFETPLFPEDAAEEYATFPLDTVIPW